MAEALMALLGFQRHKRGEWRMAGGFKGLKKRHDALAKKLDEPTPLVFYNAHPTETEMVALFAAARAGDEAAIAKLPGFLRDRKRVDWVGDLAARATQQIIARAAGGDPVFEAGVRAKADDLMAELGGASPTLLERMLARRAVNGWLAVHLAEIELTRVTDRPTRLRIETILGKAERRTMSAIRELAVVRRLQAPALLARLELVAAGGPVPRPALALEG